MPLFIHESVIDAPIEAVFAFHERADALSKLTPRFPPARVVERQGGLEKGARVVLEIGLGPLKQRWVALHTGYEKNRYFVDEQVSGPFRRWVHRHEFESEGGRTRLRDRVEFNLKGGPVMDALAGWFARLMLRPMFRHRHQVTRSETERRPPG